MFGAPDCALDEAMVTMRPHPASSMSGTAAWTQAKVPVRLTAMIRSHASGVMSASGVNDSMPALVTRIPTGPSASRDIGDGGVDRARSATSTSTPIAVAPSACSAAAAEADPVAVAVEQGDGVAVGGELLGDAEADARGGAGDDGDPGHAAGSIGVELEVQLGEAAEDPGRLVVEAPVAGRAVVLLGEPDVARAVEDALEADPALGAGQRTAGAGVGAPAEGDVGGGVRAVDAELVRALEPAGVAVGGAVEEHQRRAGRDLDAADGRSCARVRRKSVFTGLSTRSTSSRKLGIFSRSARGARPGARGARRGA